MAAKMWKTPTAAPSSHGGGGGELHKQVTRMWPTPTSSDGTGGPGSSGRDGGDNLRTAVQMWPTPMARDAGRGAWANKQQTNTWGRPLPERIGGPLNPTWVEWLQGFPLGWTEI
jgi:hypothetical protein